MHPKYVDEAIESSSSNRKVAVAITAFPEVKKLVDIWTVFTTFWRISRYKYQTTNLAKTNPSATASAISTSITVRPAVLKNSNFNVHERSQLIQVVW